MKTFVIHSILRQRVPQLNPIGLKEHLLLLFWTCLLLLSFHAPDLVGRPWAISSSLFPFHSDLMDFYRILHLQAKKSYSSFILQEETVSFLWFGVLFPWLSPFWSSTAFHLKHRAKTLYTVLWINVHNMQWHYNAIWFVYVFSWFFSISNFLSFFFFFDDYWVLKLTYWGDWCSTDWYSDPALNRGVGV